MNSIVDQLGIDPKALAGPAWVTLLYIAVYYAFMVNLLVVKLQLHREYAARGERFDRYFTQDRRLLAADRTQLNMLEHMPVFLVLLWLHAFLVSTSEAAILGAIYTGTRALYPVLLRGKLGRDIPKRILLVTFTGYFVLIALGLRILTQLL